METSWSEQKISDGFELYDDKLEQILGYPYVYTAAGFDKLAKGVWLDYGCGPGKVAYRFAEKSGHKIIAVDESERMICIAKNSRPHFLIEYVKVENDDLSFIRDNSIDGAILCFVLLNIGSKERIQKILANIFCKLKSGAPCVILDTHPSSTGVPFSTFQSGLSGEKYIDGSLRPASLFLSDSNVLPLNGYYWSEEFYTNILRSTRYDNIKKQAPTLKNTVMSQVSEHYPNQKKELLNEWHFPPYIIISGQKVNGNF